MSSFAAEYGHLFDGATQGLGAGSKRNDDFEALRPGANLYPNQGKNINLLDNFKHFGPFVSQSPGAGVPPSMQRKEQRGKSYDFSGIGARALAPAYGKDRDFIGAAVEHQRQHQTSGVAQVMAPSYHSPK